MKGALCMIETYRRLEEVTKHVEDPGPLKFRRCRELFTIPKDIPFAVVPINEDLDFELFVNYIDRMNIGIDIEYIKGCWNSTTIEIKDALTDDDESINESEDDDDFSSLKRREIQSSERSSDDLSLEDDDDLSLEDDDEDENNDDIKKINKREMKYKEKSEDQEEDQEEDQDQDDDEDLSLGEETTSDED